MLNGVAFVPRQDATVNLDSGAASVRVLVSAAQQPQVTVRIINDGSATVWIKSGDVTVTADVTNDIPVRAGASEIMTFKAPTGGLYIAAIAAGATGKIYFTPGAGM